MDGMPSRGGPPEMMSENGMLLVVKSVFGNWNSQLDGTLSLQAGNAITPITAKADENTPSLENVLLSIVSGYLSQI